MSPFHPLLAAQRRRRAPTVPLPSAPGGAAPPPRVLDMRLETIDTES
jgi:hypothetical protein